MAKNAAKLITKNGNQIEVANIAEAAPETISCFQQASTLFIDTETTGLHPWKGAEIALMQIHDRESGKTLLGRVAEHQPPPEWLVDTFKMGKKMVGHNLAGFDIAFLHSWGLPWKQPDYYDTLIAEALITTSGRRDVSKSLRASVKRRTGYEIDKEIEHGNWRADEMSDRQIEYAAIDVLALPQLMDEQIAKAEQDGSARALDMEMKVLKVTAQMNINGLPINEDNLDLYMKQSQEKLARAKVLLVEKLGDINFGSTQQVKKALAKIGINLDSTAKNVLLDQIQFDPEAENSQVLQALLDYRAPSKRQSMYGSAEWREKHIQPDGRIHARFWQVGADTTRYSSSDPNLQQVPKDGRWIIGGLPGYKIVSVDYSQIEVRIAADISDDEVLIKMLAHDDVHSAIASQVFQKPAASVTPKERKMAKAMVFTLLFGGSPRVLYEYARRSGSHITEEEAEDLFVRFFTAFSGLRQMRQKAYAINRNRRVAVITLPNGARRILAGRTNSPPHILNTPVQGTAAVGLKYGLIYALERGLDKYLGAVVHDETVSCVPDREAEDYAQEMSECLVRGMEQVVTKCPVKTEVKIGEVWQP